MAPRSASKLAKPSKVVAKRADDEDDYSEAGPTESLLKMRKDTIPEPKLVPDGTWVLGGRSVKYKEAEEGNEQGLLARVTFTFVPKSAKEDVAEDEVADNLWKGVPIFHDVRIMKSSDMGSVEKLLAKCGVDTEDGDVSDWIKAFNKAKPGVIASVGHQSWPDKTTGETRRKNVLSQFTSVD